jgi:outer membrane lipoprotein
MVCITLLVLSGCSVISPEVRRDVTRDITVMAVQSNPDMYRGRKVIWGGSIISLKNLKEFTVIQVLQHPLDVRDRVRTRKESSGRFLVVVSGYRDSEIYKKEKEIIVAATLDGVRVEKINEMEYAYPVLKPIEMKLFEPFDESDYDRSYPLHHSPYSYDPYSYDPYYSDPYLCDPRHPNYPHSCVRPYRRRPYLWYPPYP